MSLGNISGWENIHVGDCWLAAAQFWLGVRVGGPLTPAWPATWCAGEAELWRIGTCTPHPTQPCTGESAANLVRCNSSSQVSTDTELLPLTCLVIPLSTSGVLAKAVVVTQQGAVLLGGIRLFPVPLQPAGRFHYGSERVQAVHANPFFNQNLFTCPPECRRRAKRWRALTVCCCCCCCGCRGYRLKVVWHTLENNSLSHQTLQLRDTQGPSFFRACGFCCRMMMMIEVMMKTRLLWHHTAALKDDAQHAVLILTLPV